MTGLQLAHRHATALNLGDEALCTAIYALLPSDCVIHEIVNEPMRGLHPGQGGHFAEGIRHQRQARQIIQLLARTDVLLVGGGDLILGYPQHYIWLRIARLLRVPVLHVGVGVNLRGAGRMVRRLVRTELPRCAHFWVRDATSLEKLREIGVGQEKLTLVPDLAYTLKTSQLIASASPFPVEWEAILQQPYIVVSVRNPEGNSVHWGEMAYRQLAETLDQMIERHGVQIVFLPFLSAAREAQRKHTRPAGDDDQYAMRVRGFMQRSDRAFVASGDLNTAQALKLLAGAQMTIGTRLHSLIFSSLVATPFVALSYNLKTDSFMRELGWERWSEPIHQLTSASLLERAEGVLSERAVLAKQLAEVMAARSAAAQAGYAALAQWLKPRPSSSLLNIVQAWAGWLRFRCLGRFGG